MKNSDLLKKHHFWILFGLVPLFVLIGVVVTGSSVGNDISAREKAISTEESTIKSKSNPKSNKLIKEMDEMIKLVNSKQDGLWRGSFAPQKNLFTFLDSPALKEIESMGLRFGDKIPERTGYEYEEFKKNEFYRKRYEKMAERIEPTRFTGGWQSILRHVNEWDSVKLTSAQIWLLMEDIWVQESLLSAIGSVNDQMAEFSRVKFERNGQIIDDPADAAHQDPLRRKFKSRTWEIELEVVTEGTKQYLKGVLTNTTDRLQLMGVGNTMTLRVWLKSGDRNAIQPFEYKIGREYLPGVGAVLKDKDGRVVLDKDGKPMPANVLEVPRAEEHTIPTGMAVDEIAFVEQAFDGRTVAIKEIRNMALGATDSRQGLDFKLEPPVGLFKDDAPPATAGPGSGPGGPGPASPTGPKSSAGFNPNSGFGQNASVARTVSGGGTVKSVIDANKNRYIRATEQIRRMPVGIAVVVDQAYMQDVLMAFANSPLRFEITQVTWNRFRGTLESSKDLGPTSTRPGESSGQVVQSGQSHFGSDFGSPGGSSRSRPGGMSPGVPGVPGRGPGAPGMPGPGPSMPGPVGGSSGYGYNPGSSTVSESQLTSGLIELKIFGIVSLYTSPDAPPAEAKKEAEAKKDDAKDKPVGKKDAEPKDKVPGAKDAKDGKDAKESMGSKDMDSGTKDKAPAKDLKDPATKTSSDSQPPKK